MTNTKLYVHGIIHRHKQTIVDHNIISQNRFIFFICCFYEAFPFWIREIDRIGNIDQSIKHITIGMMKLL